MSETIIIIIFFIGLLTGVTSVILKKIFVFQYMNLKRGVVKGTIIQAIFDNPVKRLGVWNTIEEGFKFSLLMPVKIDNETTELKRLTRNIQKTHYLMYFVVILAILLGFIVEQFYPDGFTVGQ